MGIQFPRPELNRINRDKVCDYIPFASTATNLVDLFQKVHYRKEPKDLPVGEVKYSTYIRNKSVGRSLLLLIPGLGNFIIGMGDLRRSKKAEALLKEAMKMKNDEQLKDRAGPNIKEKTMLPLLKEAADLGNVTAMLETAKLLKELNRLDESNDWFKKAAAFGNDEAQAKVNALETGKEQLSPAEIAEQQANAKAKAAEEKRLKDLFEKSKATADSDNGTRLIGYQKNLRHAQFEVGMMLYDGVGVQQNFEEAFKYFEMAARPLLPDSPNARPVRNPPPGHPEALRMMGKMHAEGKGVEKNRGTADQIARHHLAGTEQGAALNQDMAKLNQQQAVNACVGQVRTGQAGSFSRLQDMLNKGYEGAKEAVATLTKEMADLRAVLTKNKKAQPQRAQAKRLIKAGVPKSQPKAAPSPAPQTPVQPKPASRAAGAVSMPGMGSMRNPAPPAVESESEEDLGPPPPPPANAGPASINPNPPPPPPLPQPGKKPPSPSTTTTNAAGETKTVGGRTFERKRPQ